MWPVLIPVAIGLGFYAWEKLFNKKPYSQPPVAPNGYKAPPVPKNVPPSWSYQGPPVAPAVPTTGKTTVTIKSGDQFTSPKTGDTFTANLPSGASWYGDNAVGIPTSIGGNTTSDATMGAKAPIVIVGIAGAGTAILNWTDSSGKHQQTMLDINTKG